MGKYDADLAKMYEDDGVDPIAYFMCKIAGELAESNRLARQRLTMPIGNILKTEEAVDQA